MRIRIHSLLFVLLLAACAEAPKPAPPPADTEVAEEEEAPPPPPPAASKIGQMALLGGELSEGQCLSGAEASRRAVFQGGIPSRTISVETGAGTRDFVPEVLRAEIKQLPGLPDEETETIYVQFNASGVIERARRNYTSVKDPSLNEQTGLLPEDSGAVKQLALSVVERCK